MSPPTDRTFPRRRVRLFAASVDAFILPLKMVCVVATCAIA
jgi:hypothetical protein